MTMTKEAWRKKYFGEEQPDCLPLPDRREEEDGRREEISLPAAVDADDGLLAAGTLYLLGMYGALESSAMLVWRKGAFSPLRLKWDKDTTTAALKAAAEEMLTTGPAFHWDRGEAAELLGQDPERVIALAPEGEIPAPDRTGLALIFRPAPGSLRISYAAALYTPAFVETLARSWRAILESFPGAERLVDLRITDREIMALLDSFNDTEVPYDHSVTVVDLFRARAAAMPENTAVAYEDRAYTYAQVDDLSDRLAGYLARQGLGRGDTVGVFIGRSEYMVIASLGVLKAGCAYVPLDPTYPDERLDIMASDAAVKYMLVDDTLVSRLEDFRDYHGPRLRISEVPGLPPVGEAERKEISAPRPEDLFTLIYTSGTTGIPKGVRLLHRNLAAYTVWYRTFFKPDETLRVTCYNSYGFDGSLADMFPPLVVGGCVVVIPEEKKLDLPAIAEIVRKHDIVIVDLSSQAGRQFALTMDCPSVKYIVVGGEKLVPFEPVYPYTIVNEYGPTEATVAITVYSMKAYEPEIPVGKASVNTAIYLVDSAGRRVPFGAVGELWVAGEQVTGGYLNQPERTREFFIPNPFSRAAGYETAYRSGDLVRYLQDGNIEFVGRQDGLVKIRGFRVELAEVEGVVREFPPVKNAAVVACKNPAGGQFIAAYVVSDEPIDKNALADYIRQRKPPYMVPAAILQIDDIPLTPNGKLKRKDLPEPELGLRETSYVAPRNETEAALAKGFALALGRERVSVEEDFFDAGGDSLSIIRLLSECRALALNFNIVYEGRTPAGIATLLAARTEESAGSREKRETHFLGPLQRLHYDWGNSLEEGYGLHCDATVYLAPGTDMERLAEAIEETLLAHPSVDIRLTPAPGGKLRWRPGDMKDLRPVVEHVSRAEYEEIRKTIRQPLNKPEVRMFCQRLFVVREKDGGESRVFYFDFLHPVIDGESIDLFLREIDAAYHGEKPEAETYSILDFYDEIEDRIDTDAYRNEQRWNRDYVRSFTRHPSMLRGDLDARGENDTRDIMVPIHADLKAVDAFIEAGDVSAGTLLAAAFGLLQGRCNGEDAAVALSIYNGRDDSRYERTMGVIYRHYPLCVRWRPEMTAAEFLRQTRESILLCRRHVLYEGDPVPLGAAFAYQGVDPGDDLEFCGGRVRYEEIEDFEEERFDFFMHRRQDDYYCNLTYNTKEYSDAFIERFLKDYVRVIHGLVRGETVREILKALD